MQDKYKSNRKNGRLPRLRKHLKKLQRVRGQLKVHDASQTVGTIAVRSAPPKSGGVI